MLFAPTNAVGIVLPPCTAELITCCYKEQVHSILDCIVAGEMLDCVLSVDIIKLLYYSIYYFSSIFLYSYIL